MANNNRSIQVFEHERIAYKGRYENKRFDKDLHKAFQSYHEQFPDTPFFSLTAYGVKFAQYVGAIRIGNTTIEVLPKADKNGSKEEWHSVLIDMLKTCRLLQAKQSGSAHLKLKANSILELYFELFIAELEQLLHQGLIKKYKQQCGQQLALKGALQFQQHLTKNLIHKERFYTRHTIYTRDHVIHQVLNEALKVIDQLVTNPGLSDKVKRVCALFPKVGKLKVTAATFDKLPLSRKHQPYQTALSIAKLILLNYRPDIKNGRKDLLAIMFDMNQLWEEYVLVMLRREKNHHCIIKGQNSKQFWETKRIRPDIFLEDRHGRNNIILDTKWKLANWRGPSDDDLKQMYVYNHYWDCSRSFLVYPKSTDEKDVNGNYHTITNCDQLMGCGMFFLQVQDKGKLNPKIGRELIEKIYDACLGTSEKCDSAMASM